MSQQKKKNRFEKREKKYHLDHLLAAEAERISKQGGEAAKVSAFKMKENEFISRKVAELKKIRQAEQRYINRDIIYIMALTSIFIVGLGALYYFDQQNGIVANLSKELTKYVK